MSNQYSLRLRRNSRSNKKGSTDKKPDKRIYKKLSHPECFIDRSIGLKAVRRKNWKNMQKREILHETYNILPN